MKKIFALMLTVTLLFCGCTGKSFDDQDGVFEQLLEEVERNVQIKYYLYANNDGVYCVNVSTGESRVLLKIAGNHSVENVITNDENTRTFFTVSDNLYYWNCDPDTSPELIGRDVTNFRVNEAVDLVVYLKDGDLYQYDLMERKMIASMTGYYKMRFSMSPDGKKIIYGGAYNGYNPDKPSNRYYIIEDGEEVGIIENTYDIAASESLSAIYYTSFPDRQVYKWEDGESEEMGFAAVNLIVMRGGDVYYSPLDGPDGVYYFDGEDTKKLSDEPGATKVSEWLCCYVKDGTAMIDYKGNSIDAGYGAIYNPAPVKGDVFWVSESGTKVLVYDREENQERGAFFRISIGKDGKLVREQILGNTDHSIFTTKIWTDNVVASIKDGVFIDGEKVKEAGIVYGEVYDEAIHSEFYEEVSKLLYCAEEGKISCYRDGKWDILVEAEGVNWLEATSAGEVIYFCNYNDEANTGDLYLYNGKNAILLGEDIAWSSLPSPWYLSGKRGYWKPDGSSSEYYDGIVKG